jgi:uncharacterized protein YecE (DUF72 family)
MGLHVGTSGWAYKEWKPAFYPEKLPAAKFLEHYARELTACEINATFYRMQSAASFARWAASVPEGFRFAVKAHRSITHGKELAPDPGFVEAFLGALAPLGPKLGAVLFQLPPYRKRDDDALGRLLGAIPASRPFAVEFRNASWDDAAVTARIASAGGTVCFADTDGAPPAALPPGAIGYVRLRAEKYTSEQRDRWRALLEREGRAREVLAFAKHEGVPAGDPFAGVGFAQWLCTNG